MKRLRRVPVWLLIALLATGIYNTMTRTQGLVPPAPAHAQSANVRTQEEKKYAGDPGGATTGSASDLATAGATPDDGVKADLAASGPGMQFLADQAGQNRTAINFMWLLICGFMVMFMQAGFALVETGFTRAKNAGHTMLMNFACYFLGITGFMICGWAFMYGAAGPIANLGGLAPISDGVKVSIADKWSLFGTKGFFLGGDMYDVGIYAMFLFQVVFMNTAVTIPTGAMAERWKFSAFIVYAFFMSMLLYPIFGHWAWGGGWLSQLGNNLGLGCGYVDFAGSGVAHAVGGLCALAGAIVLGPRLGKYNRDGSANAIPGHHIPMAILGTLILGFGWFGFNPGSTFGAAGSGNLRIGVVATVTMLASAGGALTSLIYMMATTRRPDPTMICNGFLAGLVAITAPSGFVSGPVAFLIGGIAGVLVCKAIELMDRVHVDDPVGAISVHGVCGLFGVLCVGLFADNTYGAGWNATSDGETARPLLGLIPSLFDAQPGIATGQLFAQLIGVATLLVWAFGLSFAFFKVQDKIMGLRVPPEDELIGLDIPETGILAYPAFRAEPDLIGYGAEPRVSVSAQSSTMMPKPQSQRDIKTGDLPA